MAESEPRYEVRQVDHGPSPPSSLFNKLPYEILCHIAKQLRPRHHSSVHPHPSAKTIQVSFVVVPARGENRDVVSFAYTSKTCYLASLPVLYHAMALLSTRQVRLLAQSLSTTTSQSQSMMHFDERRPRHLFLPNDGLLVGPSDQLMDQHQWAPSLRTIFRRSDLLDSIFLASRSDGALLSEFFDEQVRARPRRITILNFYASPPFSMWDLRPLSRVTHLHLINLMPRHDILQVLSGSSHHSQSPHPITHLRLSQVHSDTLHGFGDYIKWRRSFDEWESLPPVERNRNGVQPPERPRVPARVSEAQATLYALAVQSAKMPHFRRFLLELAELAPLSDPEQIPFLPTNIEGDRSITDESTSPHDSPGPSLEQVEALVEEAERRRTAHRDLYWIDTRDGKEALQALFNETRSQVQSRQDSQASTAVGVDHGEQALPQVQVRIVAPRPGGWDRFECRADFEAQVEACDLASVHRRIGRKDERTSKSRRKIDEDGDDDDDDGDGDGDGEGEEEEGDNDGTCFSDPDVFTLAETRPWLSHDGAHRSGWKEPPRDVGEISGGQTLEEGDWRDPLRSWWTGILPRCNASASIQWQLGNNRNGDGNS